MRGYCSLFPLSVLASLGHLSHKERQGVRFIISHACQLPDALRPFHSGSGLISVPEVVVDQGLHRHIKQVSDILQADSIHVEAPAGFPIPDDLGVRADQICQLPTAVTVPSAEKAKVFTKLTVV